MKFHALSLGIIALSLAAGWSVRMWRQQQSGEREQQAARDQSDQTKRTAPSPSPTPEPPPALAENPLRTQLTGLLEMVTALRTVEDCQRLLEALSRQPMDDYSVESLPVPIWHLLFKKWTALDPLSAMHASNAVPQRQLASNLLRTVMETWVARDRETALAALKDLPHGWAQSMGASVLFGALGKSDPAGALHLLTTLPPEQGRDDHIASVLNGWAQTDPQSALAWVLTEKDTPTRMGRLEGLLRGGFQYQNTQLAWDTVLQHVTDPVRRSELLGSMVMTSGQSAPADTLRRIQKLPEQERASHLYSLGEWTYHVRRESTAAAELEALVPASGPERDSWTAGCARGFLIDGDKPDPAAALALIARLPSGEQRNSLLKEAGEVWAKRDAFTASEYFNTQPPGPDRDAMLGEYVRAHFSNDPEAALIWSTAITDSGKRSRRLDELLPQWHQRDASAAEMWVQTSDRLAEGERAALLEKARSH